jgi:phosphatidylglycerophosphate synthase
LEPPKDKNDVGLEPGMLWANELTSEAAVDETSAKDVETVTTEPGPAEHAEAPINAESDGSDTGEESVETASLSDSKDAGEEPVENSQAVVQERSKQDTVDIERLPNELASEEKKDLEESGQDEITGEPGVEAASLDKDSEADASGAAVSADKDSVSLDEDSEADASGAAVSADKDSASLDEDPEATPSLDAVREEIVGKKAKKGDTRRVKTVGFESPRTASGSATSTKDEDKSRAVLNQRSSSRLAASANRRRKASQSRSAAEDAVVGTVIFVDDYAVGSHGDTPPSPFAAIGGVSLLRRTILTAQRAGLNKFHLLTRPSLRERVRKEVKVSGVAYEFVDSLEVTSFPDKGRLLILDPGSVHDVESLRRLQKWRGARAALLCTKLGDGMRVQIEGVRVREIGLDLVPFDACTGGAISIPMELLPRIFTEGYQKMLQDLVDEELLGASFASASSGREIHHQTELEDVREELLSNLGLNTDGFMDRLVNRRISAQLTRSLYRLDWIKPSYITAIACLFGLLAGPLIALTGRIPYAVVFASLSLWLSLILDTVDGELARLKLETSVRGRLFDRCAKTLVHFSVLVGIVSWFKNDFWMVVPSAFLALGFLMSAIVSYSQKARLPEGMIVSWGDHFDGLLLNQNYFYLTLPIFIVSAFLPNAGLLMLPLMWASALMVNICWIALKFAGTKNRETS